MGTPKWRGLPLSQPVGARPPRWRPSTPETGLLSVSLEQDTGCSQLPPDSLLPCWVLVGTCVASTSHPGWFGLLRPYLVPFFFEKVFLTLRWRLLSSKAVNPPLSRVTVSSMLEMLFPKPRRMSLGAVEKGSRQLC